MPVIFEESDGSLSVSESGLFLVPSDGCVVHERFDSREDRRKSTKEGVA